MQSPSWLKYIFFLLGTSKAEGHWISVWQCGGKGVDLMPCYGGTPQQPRKDREDMFCAASTGLGLDLCLMGDSTGLFSFSGFSYFCPVCHASSAVLMSFKWRLAALSAWGCQCQAGGIVGLLPCWGWCQAGMAQGSLCCLSQQPLTGGTGQGEKKRGVGSKRNCIFTFL